MSRDDTYINDFIEKHGLTDDLKRAAALGYMADKIVEAISYVSASMSIGLFPEDKLADLSSSIDAYLRLMSIDRKMRNEKDTEVSGSN